MNAVEIEQAISDLALQPFDAAEFSFAFLAAFGNKDTTLRRLRAGNNNASDVPGGVLQRNNIHIAVCQPGSTGAGLHALRSSPATAKGKAKFIVATDGQTLEAEDLTAGETIACDYPDFPDHFGFFLPLAGISTVKEIKDILRFHEAHKRAPQHGEGRDIFERLYAVRLDQLRKLPEAHALLAELDKPGLLSDAPAAPIDVNELDEDALLAELDVSSDPSDHADITVLRHVRSLAERQAAEEIADRTPCEDFDKFQPLFEQVERELSAGIRKAIQFKGEASVDQGNFFIVGGQFAYVAEKGEEFETSSRQPDARLRLIYGNGTESNLLMRSLQRALTQDGNGRRLSEPDAGPLFGDAAEPDDIESGTIYVLRSLSKHPFVSEHRMLIHKIGVTGGKVATRIADAENQSTYLLAPVEIVAEYRLHNLNRTKMENIFHRLFSSVQLDLTIEDRFGRPVKPREWFVVPMHVIDEAVERIRDGTITELVYDPHTAKLTIAAKGG